MSNKVMLINVAEGHECRIAIMEDRRLEELYTERTSNASKVGNIYKGRITNIEPSIQAAFIDFGGVKNGFLHISDLHPQFFPSSKKATESVGRRTAHRTRPHIQDALRRGEEIVVQITKEGIGTKGPTLTTYLSIPGRLVVMMPAMSQVGISRKIEDEEARAKLRTTLDQLEIPKDMGVIVRTAGMGHTKRDLQRDLSYLSRLWKTVQERINSTKAPAEIYQESDLVIRTIRDVFGSDINRIVCDNKAVTVKVKEFLDVAVPRAKCKIELYVGEKGLFDEFGMEEEIQKIHSRRVELIRGGSLVIDQTEALVAIDVNSGSFRKYSNAETNVLNLNLQAAEEIGRQLRLRDMGGVIIIDFVDMRDDKNRRTLERTLRDILKKDRAKSKVLRISSFGIVEMTRQRLRPSFKQSVYSLCPHCDGKGLIMSQESVALRVMRDLLAASAKEDVASIDVAVTPSVAHHLSNPQRQTITELEQRTGKTIIITADSEMAGDNVQISCLNQRGSVVAWEPQPGGGAKQAKIKIKDIRELMHKASSPPPSKSKEKPHEEQEEKIEKKPRRRGRRGGRKPSEKPADSSKLSDTSEAKDSSKVSDSSDVKGSNEVKDSSKEKEQDATAVKKKKKSRRRGHRGGRKHRKKTNDTDKPEQTETPGDKT